MKIGSVFIKNFKAYEKKTITLYNHNIFIGENDCGKTTLLEALDIFFNNTPINKLYVRDQENNVEIGMYIYTSECPDGVFLKKIYSPSTYKEKESLRIGDFNTIENIKYIYLQAGTNDPLKIVNDLAVAKVLDNTPSELLEQLKSISQEALNNVVENIDNDLIVINNGNETNVVGEQSFKYEAGIKFNIKSDNIPIEARGLGFQKNLVYALLTKGQYDNVILGIDEVENSISLNNTKNLIEKVQEKFMQTIITTHSKKVVEVRNEAKVIPILNQQFSSLIELLAALDNTNEKKYLLLEGKYDLPWYSKALTLINKRSEYIIIPAGGDGNIDALKVSLEAEGKVCFYIKDGDTGDQNGLLKDCIELYTPLEHLNRIFNLELEEIPNDKDTFFSATIIEDVLNSDSVKDKLSQHVEEFLEVDNELIEEVKQILGID